MCFLRLLTRIWLPLLLVFANSSGLAATNSVLSTLDARSLTTISTLLKAPELRSLRQREILLIRHSHVSKKNSRLAKDRTVQFLVQGGLHGNEKLSSSFVFWLADRFRKGESLLNSLNASRITIDFVPSANPDGAAMNSRYNHRGVNLNRNFAILWGTSRENPGKESFSEPEARAIRALLLANDYHAAVDVHGYINWLVAPSSPQYVGKQDDPVAQRRWSRWRDTLEQSMSLLSGYQLKTAAELGDGGAFEDWAFWARGIQSFCLEMAYRQRHVDVQRGLNNVSMDTFATYEELVAKVFSLSLQP